MDAVEEEPQELLCVLLAVARESGGHAADAVFKILWSNIVVTAYAILEEAEITT